MPGIAKPTVTKMETAKAPVKTGASNAQAQAIMQTAAKLTPPQPEKKAEAKPEAKAEKKK